MQAMQVGQLCGDAPGTHVIQVHTLLRGLKWDAIGAGELCWDVCRLQVSEPCWEESGVQEIVRQQLWDASGAQVREHF